MFCKYCGKPIDEGSMRCKICGRPVGQLEGGNSFWDLKEDRQKQQAEAPAPAETPTPTPPQEGIPTVAAPSPADAKSIRELRNQVKKLQEEVKVLGPQKRNALAGGAILLALLALALGAFVLYQLRGFISQTETLSRQTAELSALVEQQGQELAAALQAPPEEGGLPTEPEARWQGFDELAGVQLFYAQDLFSGPNKGQNDLRGQSIKLGPPDLGFEETRIFTARFQGPAGTYMFYWVRVESNDAAMETYFTPIKEEEGFQVHRPLPSDTDQTYVLSIVGDVKEEQLGRYAFVALETQTRSAYVSGIVELYNRAEQTAGVQGGAG